jgi:hypothetical protein
VYENAWKPGGQQFTVDPKSFRTDKGKTTMSDYDVGLAQFEVVRSQNARVLRGGERDNPLLKASGPRPEAIAQSFEMTEHYPLFGNE